MATLLGWKDVLRPIRDGYRHLFPSPDKGPTPEQRRIERERDRLKGFTYFDTFEQLEGWNESESDPIQRANTPLLPRVRDSAGSSDGRTKVLLCHDYFGNYHNYESIQETGVDEEYYTCEYLHLVESFVYFSHKLVCVPPSSWTNTLHRNGVKALGVLLVEPQTQRTEKLLQRCTQSGESHASHFPMATKLAAIARHHDIDGWLVNIEKPFPTGIWDANLLEAFLQQLKSNLGEDRQLIWYDALTTSNRISYQNALTTSNLLFAKACGSILTNYSWKEADAENSKQMAEQNNLPAYQVFVGIDVWAQNPSALTHTRITYPEKGGGGTNTGIATAKLAELGLSAGIFAPGWSYEHFPGKGRAIERAIWEGNALPDEVDCSCGNASVRHPRNEVLPVVQSAEEFPAGSKNFFYTDFNRGFGEHGEKEGSKVFNGKYIHSQLGSQAPLPLVARAAVSSANVISYRLEQLVGRTQLTIEVHNISSDKTPGKIYESWLPLFKLNMPADGSLQLTISCQSTTIMPVIEGSFYARLGDKIIYVPFEDIENSQTHDIADDTESGASPRRLQEIGIMIRAPHLGQEPFRILEIFEMCIAPHRHFECPTVSTIEGLRIEDRGEGENQHKRLCWTFTEDKTESKKMTMLGLPYSAITGPFSHFLVQVDDLALGRAYALEYVFSRELEDSWAGEEVKVTIAGIGFDGRRRAACSSMMRI